MGRPLTEVDSFLDFASGYGRATRFLVRDQFADNITISDIYEDAVKFQKEEFDVCGFVSHEDPDQLKIPDRYEVVTCISLFTHLPETLFLRWIKKLTGSLKENGIFIFTTHDTDLYDGDTQGKDFLFYSSSESLTLDAEIYGTTHASYQYISQLFGKHIPGYKIIGYLPKGLNNIQDIYIIGAQTGQEHKMGPLFFPQAHLDVVEIQDNFVRFSGWAYNDMDKTLLTEIHGIMDETCIGNAILGIERPDVAEYFNAPEALLSGFHGELVFDNNILSDVFWLELIGNKSGNLGLFKQINS